MLLALRLGKARLDQPEERGPPWCPSPVHLTRYHGPCAPHQRGRRQEPGHRRPSRRQLGTRRGLLNTGFIMPIRAADSDYGRSMGAV